MTTSRFAQLQCWAQKITQQSDLEISLISGDASFRKYYRGAKSIWVDAPPETEKNQEFVTNANALAMAGINAPIVLAADLNHGFLQVSDLGDCSLLSRLTHESVLSWYLNALSLLPEFSKIHVNLPQFDQAFMARENTIFPEWYLQQHLRLELSADDQSLLEETFYLLAENNLQQPQVVMHRDFHSRNLMVLDNNELAVIDFQDMVFGPLTYDAVSLLKDCYCRWPDEVISAGVMHSYQLYLDKGILTPDIDFSTFRKWLDLTGMQRHLKAIGIFARLNHRDGKSGYLKDIPRTFSYVAEVAATYPELHRFSDWLKSRVLPVQPI